MCENLGDKFKIVSTVFLALFFHRFLPPKLVKYTFNTIFFVFEDL